MSRLPASTQVKITLPEQLYFFLKSKADKFDLPVSSYIKNLVINDVKDLDFPTFKMSAKNEEIGLKALVDFKKGNIRHIKDVDKYLDSL